MEYWNRYVAFIAKQSGLTGNQDQAKEFWRTSLFVRAIAFVIPLSIPALVFGVIMSLDANLPQIAAVDLIVWILLLVIAFVPGIKIHARKIFFLTIMYLLSAVLLLFLGPFGPGLLYLLATSILSTLIVSTRAGITSALLNAILVLAGGLLLHFDVVNTPFTRFYNPGSWLAVSLNLIFLNASLVAGIHFLLKSLYKTTSKTEALTRELLIKSMEMDKALKLADFKNEELEEFVFIASHDLKEPVRSMVTISEMFREDYKGKLDGQQEQYLAFISSAAQRMQTLIVSLLDYAQTHELPPTTTNPDKVMEEVLEDLQSLIRRNQALISFEPLPEVKMHPVELKQLFQNLISNSIKFRKKDVNPVIHISAKSNRSFHTFTFRDNGIGIPADQQTAVFQMFKRLHNRQEIEGSGIGLAHCLKIIQRHGGNIWAESEPGKGSSFHFTIPV